MKICRAVKHPSGGSRSSPIDKSMRVTLHAGMTLATVNLSTFMRSKILCDSCSIFCLVVFRGKAKIFSSPQNYKLVICRYYCWCIEHNALLTPLSQPRFIWQTYNMVSRMRFCRLIHTIMTNKKLTSASSHEYTAFPSDINPYRTNVENRVSS